MDVRRHQAAGCAVVALLVSAATQAGITEYQVSGTQSPAENGCSASWAVFYRDDCSYNATDPTGQASGEWIGPAFAAAYYATGQSHFDRNGPTALLPTAGDGKLAVPLSGVLVIDDGGTPLNCADDSLSGTLMLGAATRTVRTGGGLVEERWSSVTHHLAATPVHAGASRAAGGCDYVLGASGFPARLLGAGDEFPSEVGSLPGPGFTGAWWLGPEPAGLGVARFEGGFNAGAASFVDPYADVTGYACITDGAGGSCTAVEVLGAALGGCAAPRPCGSFGWENLLLRLQTDGAGGLNAQAFGVHESDTVLSVAGADSWQAVVLDFAAEPSVPVPLPLRIDVAPHDPENRINLHAGGFIRVAIIDDGGLPLESLDLASARLGPGGAPANPRAQWRDVDEDGDLDVELRFRTRAAGIGCDDETVSLEILRLSGDAVSAQDGISVSGCR